MCHTFDFCGAVSVNSVIVFFSCMHKACDSTSIMTMLVSKSCHNFRFSSYHLPNLVGVSPLVLIRFRQLHLFRPYNFLSIAYGIAISIFWCYSQSSRFFLSFFICLSHSWSVLSIHLYYLCKSVWMLNLLDTTVKAELLDLIRSIRSHGEMYQVAFAWIINNSQYLWALAAFGCRGGISAAWS